MVVGALGYWAIGLVAGWALGFPLGLGPVGLWWGLALGLAVAAVLLSLRFAALTRPGSAGPTSAAALTWPTVAVAQRSASNDTDTPRRSDLLTHATVPIGPAVLGWVRSLVWQLVR